MMEANVPEAEILRGGLLPDRPALGAVDIVVSDGTIVGMDVAGSLNGGTVRDLDGAWILPGVIDAHVHPIHAEDFDSVGEESVLGGITTVLNHLYPEPGETLEESVQRADRLAVKGAADFGYHLRMTPGRVNGTDGGPALAEQLATVAMVPGVVSVKSFLAYSDPTVMSTMSDLTRILIAARSADLPVIVHAEAGDVIAVLESVEGLPDSLFEHDHLRSMDLEGATVTMAAAIAKAVAARLYIAHMSNVVAVAAARDARARGARIMGETCPHYLFLDTAQDLGGLGRVTPPLRDVDAVEAMRALVGDPTSGVDLVASDHCGYASEEKPKERFACAGNGLPGIEAMLGLLLDAALSDAWVTPADIVRLLCAGPASAFGLLSKGAIAPGCDADLVVIDPGASTTLAQFPPGPATAPSPYAGMQLRGAITDVYRRGSLAVSNGVRTGLAGGQPVRREIPGW